MRICVLAFDGLEYDLVVKWRLRHLMQKYYGAYKSLVNPKYGKPYTPTCWASFISGKPMEEHKVTTWWSWGAILEKLRYFPPFVWVKGKRKILMRLGIRPKLRTLPSYITTIFDVIKPSVALFIPSYNEPIEFRNMYDDAAKKGLKELEKTIWAIHEIRKNIFFEYLDKDDWRLLMCWFDLADMIAHLYSSRRSKLRLMKAYFELNNIAKKVRERIGDDVAVLIVSDHGIQKLPDGSIDHSNHGFWSLNVKPPFTPKEIIDFYKLVIELAKRR